MIKDKGCWDHGTGCAGGCNKICPHLLLPAPSPLSLTCCSASVSSFSVSLPGVAQQHPNTDSCRPHWEPGASLGPWKSHPEATSHLCAGWSSRDPCALLTPSSSCNKGSLSLGSSQSCFQLYLASQCSGTSSLPRFPPIPGMDQLTAVHFRLCSLPRSSPSAAFC